jgi:phage gp29-like protein
MVSHNAARVRTIEAEGFISGLVLRQDESERANDVGLGPRRLLSAKKSGNFQLAAQYWQTGWFHPRDRYGGGLCFRNGLFAPMMWTFLFRHSE